MSNLLKVKAIYFHYLSKAQTQGFHQSVVTLLKDSSISAETELIDIISRYEEQIKKMEDLVGVSRKLDVTQQIKNAENDMSTQYRYMFRTFQNLEYDHTLVTEEEFARLQHEVLDVFPLMMLRLPIAERYGNLSVLIEHLKADWMPLMERISLMAAFRKLEEAVASVGSALIDKAEEKSQLVRGEAKTCMDELLQTYQLLVLYLEAWSNNWSQNTEVQRRREAATAVVQKCNVLAAELKHSVAVARSNRRRARKE